MEIELGQLMRATRRFWWVPVVLGLVFGLLGIGGAGLTPSTYPATSQMLVMSQVTGNDLVAGSSRTGTYVNLAKSGPILDRVILELGLSEEYERDDLDGLIRVESIGAQIIEVTVETEDPELSAAIANSLTRHLIVLATDLSIGELERNLAEVQRQIDVHRDSLSTIEARLLEIDIPGNADNSEVQAEISLLKRERIRTSQIIADLERTARAFNTELSTMTAPLVITDDAQADYEGTVLVSPILLALLGAFFGGLTGVAWILWSALSDRTLRAVDQAVSLPILARLASSELDDETSKPIAVLAAKLAGVSKGSDASSLAVISTRGKEFASSLRSALAAEDPAYFSNVQSAGSVLEDAEAMRTASKVSEAVIVATLNDTSLDDLEELAEVLASANTRVMGTVIVK